MDGKQLGPEKSPSTQGSAQSPMHQGSGQRPKETGGPTGPEPTRYGDWERRGRCIDF